MVLADYGLAGGGSIEVQLETIYASLSEFCRANTIPLHMENITKHLLAFGRDSDYPVGPFSYLESSF